MATPKAHFASSLVGQDWIITGGVPSLSPSVQVFDKNVFQAIEQLSVNMTLDHCQVTIDDETIFLASGEEVFLYNFVTEEIEILNTIPSDNVGDFGVDCGFVINAVGEKEIVAIPFNDKETAIFSMSSKEWRLGPSRPGLVVLPIQLEDTFAIIGGDSSPDEYGQNAESNVYLFNTTTYQLDLLEQELIDKRQDTIAVAVPDEFVTCKT